jgi:hypothetical protein
MALLPDPQVARDRYRVNPRTIVRWDADPDLKFPPPTVINNRKYRDVAALDAWDKWRAAGGGERRPVAGRGQAGGRRHAWPREGGNCRRCIPR